MAMWVAIKRFNIAQQMCMLVAMKPFNNYATYGHLSMEAYMPICGHVQIWGSGG